MFKEEAADKALSFNNAGVFMLENGHIGVAWNLFKGSLELYRLVEGTQDQMIVDMAAFSTNPYIVHADGHLKQINNGLIERMGATRPDNSTTGNVATQANEDTNEIEANTSSREVDFVFYSPYIYDKGFCIPEVLSAKIGLSSAIVIFNLAMVEQLVNPTSNQAISLYELALSLLVGYPIRAFGVAILNNMGVWRFQNNDIDRAHKCMEMLARAITYLKSTKDIGVEEFQAIQRNIRWILTPTCIASAAA